jgi:hypothetical protein
MDKNYKQIDFRAGSSIEQAVDQLIDCNSSGISAFGDFNNVLLYSDTVTMDGAYMAITGYSKADFDKLQQKQADDYKKSRIEHEDKIPELTELWIQRGKEILTEDRWPRWAEIVPIRLGDLYQGMELECCLDIVKILNSKGTLDEAKAKIHDQGHSGMSFGLVCSMVKVFADRGAEFVGYVR